MRRKGERELERKEIEWLLYESREYVFSELNIKSVANPKNSQFKFHIKDSTSFSSKNFSLSAFSRRLNPALTLFVLLRLLMHKEYNTITLICGNNHCWWINFTTLYDKLKKESIVTLFRLKSREIKYKSKYSDVIPRYPNQTWRVSVWIIQTTIWLKYRKYVIVKSAWLDIARSKSWKDTPTFQAFHIQLFILND